MAMKHVEGNKKGEVTLYALSTCIWCRKTKDLLNKLGVDYSFVDVDLLAGSERAKVMEEVRRWNPACSFPTLVVDNKTCVKGFDEEKIKELLG